MLKFWTPDRLHMHLTGMQSIWDPGPAADMTGADFMDVINKAGPYQLAGGALGGGMKDDVTFRELRFVWRYWDRALLMPDNTGTPQAYTFNGSVTFYFDGRKVKPPWQWNAADTGASPASRA